MSRVLFVAPSAYLLSGLAAWLQYLIPGLVDEGWDAWLGLVSGPHHHRPSQYLVSHPTNRHKIAHCATATPEGRRRALTKLLQQLQPELAISVNIPDLFVAINHLRQRQQPAPYAVMSVHGIEAYLYADMRRYGEMLDGVVCTNRLACQLASALGNVDHAKIQYAPYGVDDSLSDHAKPPRELLRIVYSGRLEMAQKRCADLVGIAHGLAKRGIPFQLDIVGDGSERAFLEQSLAPEMAQGTVRLHGYLPSNELSTRIYPAAHALIITSYWETGPIVAWESMAQGLPVVSARYVGSGLEAALVDNYNALLFDIGDINRAVDALARLWHEPETWQALARAGQRLVKERYSWSASVNSWKQALEQIRNQPIVPAIDLPLPKDSGRLDRWFGTSFAEQLREIAPRTTHRTSDAGGEWPHAHENAPSDEAFWQLAKATDNAILRVTETRTKHCNARCDSRARRSNRIGANAVATHDVPEYEIWGGEPPRKLGEQT